MRKLNLFAAMALTVAGMSSIGHAQSQNGPDVQRAMATLDSHLKKLDVELNNLQQMEKALFGSSIANQAIAFGSAGQIVRFAAGSVETTAQILAHMTSPDDARYVRHVFGVQATLLVEIANSQIDMLNEVLPDLKLMGPSSSGLVAEGTELRDLMVEIRHTIKPFEVKE